MLGVLPAWEAQDWKAEQVWGFVVRSDGGRALKERPVSPLEGSHPCYSIAASAVLRHSG